MPRSPGPGEGCTSRNARLPRFQILLAVGLAGLRIRLAQDREIVERRGGGGGGSRQQWRAGEKR